MLVLSSRLALTIISTVFGSLSIPSDQSVGPGSVAPPLDIKRWVKGTPVDSRLGKGIFVVDFGATWCAPCRESIPHLTSLAKKYPDVNIIGVDIWEPDSGDVISSFVHKMGARMDYAVGYSGNQDGMAQTWMAAAGRDGIPTVFIVRDGIIQWIGGPAAMDRPLEEIRSGTFSVRIFASAFESTAKKKRRQITGRAEIRKIAAAYSSGDVTMAKRRLHIFAVQWPDLRSSVDALKYEWCAKENDVAWKALTQELVSSAKPSAKDMVLSFALTQAERHGNLEQAKFAVRTVLDATKGSDLEAQLYAYTFYTDLNMDREVVNAIDTILRLQPNSRLRGDSALRSSLLQDRRARMRRPVFKA